MWFLMLFLRLGGWVKTAAMLGISIFAALPTWAKTLIMVAAALAIVYVVGERQGAQRVQTKWDAATAAAVQKATEIGNKANADAEKSVPQLAPADRASDAAIAPRGKPCVVRDRFDRDCAGH